MTTVEGAPVKRAIQRIDWSPAMAEKAGYKHFMLKEIFEQPRALEDTFRGRLDRQAGDINGAEIGLTDADAADIKRVANQYLNENLLKLEIKPGGGSMPMPTAP